jgi:hypothetical protein
VSRPVGLRSLTRHDTEAAAGRDPGRGAGRRLRIVRILQRLGMTETGRGDAFLGDPTCFHRLAITRSAWVATR